MIKKMQAAIERLKSFEPPEGYYLAFSGGKDSQCVYHLCKMAGVKFDAHYSVTTIDPPDLVRFIKKNYPDVKWERPEVPLLKMLETRGFPLRQGRWCCAIYKEKGGQGRRVVTGIRWEESRKRAGRKMVEQCFKDGSKTYLNPIIDWSHSDVWNFIRRNNIKYCNLYDMGWKRLGCLFCPNESARLKRKSKALYPQYYEAFRRSFNNLYANRVREGNDSVKRWKNGDDMFEWWLFGEHRESPDQLVMFE